MPFVAETLGAGRADDVVLPFQVDGLNIRGRVARLGPALDTILRQHAYPRPVSSLLGEALALAAAVGSSLKYDGIFSVQASATNASDTRVVWSYSWNGKTVPSKCATYALPSGMLAKGGSTIVVESSFLFKPLFVNVIPGLSTMTWTDKSYHSPRNSCVDYVKGDNCSSLSC